MAGILGQPVALHNVRDIEAVIAVAIRRSGLELNEEQWAELMNEGLLIACEMAAKFNGTGDFSGYLMAYLPRKLGGAWHRIHETHVLVSRGGKRKWVYYDPPLSLDKPTTGQVDSTSGEAFTTTRGDGLHDRNCRTVGNFVAHPVDIPT